MAAKVAGDAPTETAKAQRIHQYVRPPTSGI